MHIDFSHPLLAIDTSTAYLSLALTSGSSIYTRYIEAGNKQSDLILPLIHELLTEANISVEDLEAIIYAQGPGMFTGLRIGISIAQGLATPFNTPLIAIPCLDAVAYQKPEEQCILAATDARMGEVFYAWFDTIHHRRLSDYQVGSATNITAPANATQPIGIGNAFALETPPPFDGSPQMPNATVYIHLARSGRYLATDAAHAELLYVRNKIALTAKEQAERKASL